MPLQARWSSHEEQTAGRGRRGRGWSSPPGINLYLSVILRPSLPPQRAPELVPVVAVAGAEAMVELGVDASIKWPNDLLIGGRKAAGILTELSASSQQVQFVVAGIGINVNAVAADFPEDLQTTATSLRIETGKPVSRSLFAASFLTHLEGWLDRHQAEGFEVIRKRYRDLSGTLGQRVRLVDGEELIEGMAEDIDDTGALYLRRDDGSLERILTGDVHTVRPVSS